MSEMPDKSHPMIEVTARNCGGLQPNVKVGNRYMVRQAVRLDNGVIRMRCVDAGQKQGFVTISSNRFAWRCLSPETVVHQAEAKRVDDDLRRLQRSFSADEQIRIAVVPLIYQYMAWHYADLAMQLAAGYRVEILKPLSRKAKELRKAWERERMADLQQKLRDQIDRECMKFIDTYAGNLGVMYFSVNNAIKRAHPDYPYDDLRTYAVMSVLCVSMEHRHDSQSAALLGKRLGTAYTFKQSKLMNALATLMRGMAGIDDDNDYRNPDFDLNCRVIANKIAELDFDIA